MLHLRPDVAPPSPAAVSRALRLLEQRLGPSKYLTAKESCEAYSHDDSEAVGRVPDAVVIAESTDDIVAALAVAREAEVPITPRAGGTGRCGGSVPVGGGIVLATAGMNQIKGIDGKEMTAVVEPGVILGDFHAAVEAEGLFYPPDANSLLACALGGNVATNAGGPRAFKYGVTRDYVLGMEAMLVGGQRIFAGRRTKKGVTGYDVAGLLVGSEGTLAVFGDITFRLVPKPPAVMTLMALFRDVHHSADAVREITGRGVIPRCIELLDAGTLQAVRDAGNPIDTAAGAMLLMDVDGEENALERDAERIGDVCDEVGAIELLAAQEASQRDRLWAARREMSPAVKRMAKNKLSEDVVVPRQKIATLLDRVARVTDEKRVRSVTYGHAGDGNLHVNFLWDDEGETPAVEACIEQLFVDVVDLGGTLTGEHGIGVLKRPYLHLEQPSELIELQREIKRVFDPKGILNPGKILPKRGHGPC